MNINKVIKKTKPRYDLGRLCIGSISININVSRSQKLKKKELFENLFWDQFTCVYYSKKLYEE